MYVGDSTSDDAYIYMRYADNYLLSGVATFNLGERSHGITSVLWFVIGALTAQVAGNTIEVWKYLSLSFYFVFSFSLALLYLTIAKSALVAILAAVLVLFDPFTFRWSSTGMENALVAISILLVVVLLIYRRVTAAVFACALLPLVRPELAVWGAVTATTAAWWMNERRERVATLALVYLIGIVASVAVNVALFDALHPQTAAAKALVLKQLDPAYALVQMLLIGTVVAALPLAVVTYFARRVRGSANELVPMLLLLGTLAYTLFVFLYAAHKNHLVSTRYSTAYVLPLTLVGLAYAVTRVEITRQAVSVLAVGVVLQATVASAVLLRTFPGTRTAEGRDIATFVSQCIDPLPASAKIATTEVGAIAHFSDKYIVDLVGLTDEKTLQYLRTHEVERADRVAKLLAFRQATHYIDPMASDENASRRVGLPMVAVCRGLVGRNNVSSGETATNWVLYELGRP
ncbi:MAG: hypothetical protein EAZ24_11770 [Burkholderiales bacterium]|nr:MAG: hypothetical protein EAZ24_11770 [Burkholderiales bacterium]TAG79746.1 MAG: hypothetical protein EAZ21_09850 [Betaproteobacteria bacterium]